MSGCQHFVLTGDEQHVGAKEKEQRCQKLKLLSHSSEYLLPISIVVLAAHSVTLLPDEQLT